MRNDFKIWLRNNAPAGRGYTGKVLPVASAAAATSLVALSVVMLAGLGLPPGQTPVDASARSAVPAQPFATAPAGQVVRHAQALPTVTVVGRREAGSTAALAAPTTTGAMPVQAASGEAAVGISIAGNNLRQ